MLDLETLSLSLYKQYFVCYIYNSCLMNNIISFNISTPDDVAIFVSNSGRSSNVVTAAKLAKQNGCTTISITQSARSPLGKYIDIPIYMSALDHTVGRDSITRRIVAMTVLETLYQAVVSHGSRNFPAMLEATMNSFEINSVLHK